MHTVDPCDAFVDQVAIGDDDQHLTVGMDLAQRFREIERNVLRPPRSEERHRNDVADVSHAPLREVEHQVLQARFARMVEQLFVPDRRAQRLTNRLALTQRRDNRRNDLANTPLRFLAHRQAMVNTLGKVQKMLVSRHG
ncbi:hypothetical protein ACRPM7_13870 [Burkholderia vietnamiensis]|uniref:hypothetical protein n=1 Tax=Burkholderia vietnamiensis TaxID=60552 RepID=UPI001CF36254|nr:hypothetical protein [Burkholderia vietnamiensis]MCA8071828.1 hypothetical protein [Burkholderia vietnamiensis]